MTELTEERIERLRLCAMMHTWPDRLETFDALIAELNTLRAENALLRAKIESTSPLHNERLRSAMMIVEAFLMRFAGTVATGDRTLLIADERIRAAWNVITGTAVDTLDALKEQR